MRALNPETWPTPLLRASGIVLVLLAWQLLGMRLGESLLATPLQVVAALSGTLGELRFWQAAGGLVWQMLAGYLAALAIGVPLGIAMGRLRWVRLAVQPWASLCVVVSAAALVPLFIILMGRGPLLGFSIVLAATVWYVVLTLTEAARAVSPSLLNAARSFGASDLQAFRWVLLPALQPFILVAARIGLTHALRAMVTAQMFISAGYGGLLNDAGLDLSTASLFGLIVVLMAASVAATAALNLVSRRLAPWSADRLAAR